MVSGDAILTSMENVGKHIFTAPSVIKELTIEELTAALIETNNKLIDANKQLTLSETLRKNTISNLSHDLRSPIATLMGLVEYLLISDEDRDETQETLMQMKGKLFHLGSIVENLLLLSYLDSEEMSENSGTKKQTRLNLGRFLISYFSTMKRNLNYSQRNLILSVPEAFNPIVSIDPELVERVLDNLYSNALKFSNDNDTIELGAYMTDGFIHVFLSDTGIGIPEAHIHKIFDRTYMVSDARTPSEAKGSGLGLSIAQSIIIKHGGDIWCESRPNIGTVFIFTLPPEPMD